MFTVNLTNADSGIPLYMFTVNLTNADSGIPLTQWLHYVLVSFDQSRC